MPSTAASVFARTTCGSSTFRLAGGGSVSRYYGAETGTMGKSRRRRLTRMPRHEDVANDVAGQLCHSPRPSTLTDRIPSPEEIPDSGATDGRFLATDTRPDKIPLHETLSGRPGGNTEAKGQWRNSSRTATCNATWMMPRTRRTEELLRRLLRLGVQIVANPASATRRQRLSRGFVTTCF